MVAVLSFGLLSGCAAVEGQPSALNPQGPVSRQVANLSWLMFAIAALVMLVVTVLLIAAGLRSRRFRTRADLQPSAAPPSDRRSLLLVILGGALTPAVVLIVMMSLSIAIENGVVSASAAAHSAAVIEVTGHQWWWEVNYPQLGIVTANEIHIPVGKPVTFKLTSADVIHSFWVPQLHPKLDVIPGQTNTLVLQADNAGTYRGECAEYCGLQHAHMQFVVIAQPQADYDQWVAQEQQPAPQPAAGSVEQQGQQAFLGSACVYCHTIQGTNASGKLGPDLTHLASRATIGAGARSNSRANLAGWVVNAQAIKPGSLMPPVELAPDQLQALLAYLETLK